MRLEFGWNVRFLSLWPLWADGRFAPQETSQAEIRKDLAGDSCVFKALIERSECEQGKCADGEFPFHRDRPGEPQGDEAHEEGDQTP